MLQSFSSKKHDKIQVKQILVDAIHPELTYESERVNKVYESYITNHRQQLYVWMENERVVGVIGIEKIGSGIYEIKHIATKRGKRGRGIGRKMIDQLIKVKKAEKLFAETDQDAVAFYRRCGFTVQSLGEKYPSVERFQCRLVIRQND